MIIPNARNAIALSLVGILFACGRPSESPEKGVDTTLPDNPGKLTGSLSFPSDYIPKDLRVCAEAADGKQFCNAQISSDSYVLEVPEGEYRVFAQTGEMPGVRAYYSEFVVCGYYSWCPSHQPLKIAVEEGGVRTGVNPGDWYAQESSEPAATAADSENYDNSGAESATDGPVQDDSSPGTEESEPGNSN